MLKKAEMNQNNRIPLFERYPLLGEKLPWVSLGNWPSPVQKLENIGRSLEYENIWIKRDDKSSDEYGGNKVRKLEFVLADAIKNKNNTIVTYGGLGTNHGLATTIYARQLGIRTILVLHNQPVTDHVQENLLLDSLYGARLVYATNKLDVLLKTVGYQITNKNLYFLPLGGSSPTGGLGFVNAAFELKQQVLSGQVPEPAYIFCPLGTAGTLAGLTLGCRLAEMKTRVIGVRVTEIGLSNEEKVSKLANRIGALLCKYDKSLPLFHFKPTDIEIMHNFFGKGYGFSTPDGLEAMELIRRTENIELEVTYTAKTFAAVVNFIRQYLSDNVPILYWHTYNGVDFTSQIKVNHDYTKLPRSFHWCFEKNLIPYLNHEETKLTGEALQNERV